MLCKIYRTTFELNHNKKLKRVIASLCDGPYRYDNYYYYKPNVLEPIIKPYNFHFNKKLEQESPDFSQERNALFLFLYQLLSVLVPDVLFYNLFAHIPQSTHVVTVAP